MSDFEDLEEIPPIDAPAQVEAPVLEPAPSPLDPAEAFGLAIEAMGDRLSRRLDAIQSLLERDTRAEANRERIVDRLHAELQEYKDDLLLKVQRPIFADLIQLHDDIGKMIEARPDVDGDDGRAASTRGILASIRVAIEDILYRQGVEPFEAEGDAFDPRRQRAVSTVLTEDPEKHRTIAARLRRGFAAGEKLIRPELVSVHTLRPPMDR